MKFAVLFGSRAQKVSLCTILVKGDQILRRIKLYRNGIDGSKFCCCLFFLALREKHV